MKLIVAGVLIAILAGSAGLAHAQSNDEMPSWVRDLAVAWGEGTISDAEFIAGIEFLIDNGVIKVSEGSNQTPEDIKCGPGTHRNDTGTCVLTTMHADTEYSSVTEPRIPTSTQAQTYDYPTITGEVPQRALDGFLADDGYGFYVNFLSEGDGYFMLNVGCESIETIHDFRVVTTTL